MRPKVMLGLLVSIVDQSEKFSPSFECGAGNRTNQKMLLPSEVFDRTVHTRPEANRVFNRATVPTPYLHEAKDNPGIVATKDPS